MGALWSGKWIDRLDTGKEVQVVKLRDGIRRLARRVTSARRSRIAAAIVVVPLVVVALTSAGVAGAVPQPAGSAIKYVVRPGDTLWKIATTHDTTVTALVTANHIKDRNLIYSGQVVWIPSRELAVQRAAVQASSSKPVFPISGYRGTVREHWGGYQGAVDLMAAEGTPIRAVMGGRVISSGWTDVGGWNLMIHGSDGLQYYYAHMQQRPLVGAGAHVATGQQIGRVGNTGNSAAPHLHIAIGPQISLNGNAKGLRPGYGINFDVSRYLNKLL